MRTTKKTTSNKGSRIWGMTTLRKALPWFALLLVSVLAYRSFQQQHQYAPVAYAQAPSANCNAFSLSPAAATQSAKPTIRAPQERHA